MKNILNYLTTNWLGFSAIIISIISLKISYKRFKSQLVTITKDFNFDLKNTFKYKTIITLKNTNEQIYIAFYKLFKRKYFIYNKYEINPMTKLEINNPIISNQILDLQPILQDLPKGKYKIIFFLNREPGKLKLKFAQPYDDLLKNSPLTQ